MNYFLCCISTIILFSGITNANTFKLLCVQDKDIDPEDGIIKMRNLIDKV